MQKKINFTYKQYFLLYKTSTKLLFCKDSYIIAEIQRVGNPERPSKLQNSSAKVSQNSRKTFAEEKKTKLAWVLGSELPADRQALSCLRPKDFYKRKDPDHVVS